MTAEAARGRVDGLVQAINARIPKFSHPVTGYLLVLMVVVGVVLRIQNVGYPFTWGFDEDQMVNAARQFLIGLPDTGECCHPPLSKLFVSASLLAFGDHPFAWRFPALCLGLQSIVVVFLLARALFKDTNAGWLAAALMAADGFFIAFSRDAFTEGMMACLVMWAMLAAVTARSWAGVLACGVLIGLAGSIKWSGLQVGLPACFAILLLRRVPWYSLALFAVVPVVHVLVWMIGLKLIGHPNDLLAVWHEIGARRSRHLGFQRNVNPLETPWYTWLVIYHPIVLKTSYVEAKIRLAASVANIPLFVAADASLLGLPLFGAAAATSARWRKRWREWFDADYTKALAIAGVCWFSMMLLWFSGRITSYWYHYLTPYSFAILLVAGLVARLDRTSGKDVLYFVILVFAALVYFAPVWAEIPISVSGAHRRLISPLWR